MGQCLEREIVISSSISPPAFGEGDMREQDWIFKILPAVVREEVFFFKSFTSRVIVFFFFFFNMNER